MKFKSIFLAGLASISLSMHAADFKEINKDMRIMKRIIETSLTDGGSNRLGNRIDATYLASQGMMFTVNSSRTFIAPEFNGDWDAWGESLGLSALSMVQEMVPAVAPVLPEEAVAEMEAEVARGMEEIELGQEKRSQLREELEKMREQLREDKEHYRDNLRELRDIERDLYRADKEERRKLEKQKEKIQKDIEKNKVAMNKYKEKMDQYRAERDKKMTLKKQEVINVTIGTLCDYAPSLKSLPSNEHITLVFNNFGKKKNETDKVYVFKKQHFKNCESNDKGVKELANRAVVYYQ